MYDTAFGIRVLHGAEARLFASGAWTLADQLRDFIPHAEAQLVNHLIGIPVLEPLTATQVIVLIDRVTRYLLDPDVEAPDRTALLDATIAAIFQQISTDIQSEIFLEIESTEATDDDTSMRTKVAAASAQIADPDSSALDTPDPECGVMDTWQFVIERLCDRVLPDTDWQLASVMLDADPNRSMAVKGRMGIGDDYFIDIVDEASVEDAARAWCDMLERITGWRPERWRFGDDVPLPADAQFPPRVDVLSFSENWRPPTDSDDNRPHFQQAKPVLLSDVVSEIESTPEGWSSYVDRKNGELVSLPSDLVVFVDDGEQPDDRCGDYAEEFLELARTICESGDFLQLPSQFEIHEWSIMRDFCNCVDRDEDRQALLEAVHGSGAFRSFKATIDRLELRDQWFDYKQAAMEAIVIDWLESNSIEWSRTPPGEPPF